MDEDVADDPRLAVTVHGQSLRVGVFVDRQVVAVGIHGCPGGHRMGETFKIYLIAKKSNCLSLIIKISGRKEGNVLFNDALNTFYLRLYGVRHMVKDPSDSEKGNPLLPHGLLFSD